MTPGILDHKLALAPLLRLSPSRYEALKLCALREGWAAGGQLPLLPLSPAARLGTVIHQLLEEAGRGQLAPGKEGAVERRWEQLVAEMEGTMRESWLERHFIPLRSSVPDYEVRRLRAQERAAGIAAATASVPKEPREPRATGFERWVASRDDSVGGYIDRISVTADGVALCDYKSGSIHDATSGSPPAVKASFVVQLRLYAALYAATTGTWPVKLELVPLQGEPVAIACDPASCEALLADAVATLARTNATIADFASAPGEAERRLANPRGETCRHCAYRPGCAEYHRARAGRTEGEDWPDDLWGVLREVRRLGNGKLLLTVGTGSADGGELRQVRGVSPEPERHPALERLQPGDVVGLFGLKSAGKGGTLSESLWTVIYKMIEMEDGEK
jgi:RecB family exonuclease